MRRKQNDMSIPRGSSEHDSSAADDSDEDEGDEPRGLLSRLKSEEDPEMPETGLLAMPFMKRGMERRKAEAEAMLCDLEEQMAAQAEEGEP